ncbi:hypothetical protein ACH46N_01870 [Streptomyces pristinaespiralis]|jgi:hypothetical protein|uniref:Secreted protein n=2 Tax=Streptomyces pristinaespiralis TaxID=38300 RepID=B5HG10_STRE2|nr:hypothetical protein [Streptomyces pristinaespiralis]ALC19684.1 Secreted protein [Streptomyces pristinaespiralis]EDY65771.1 secreted protein [Streptomyces pristinaespiralis ATCC 25486]QMU17326.1 hypothetical protein H3L99_30070 [Streptomyces pristinaespiralis]
MTDDVRNIVLGVVAAGISATIGWLARTYLWRRRLRRKQGFFGLPGNSESLLVVNREAGRDGSVHRFDVFALLELSALIKDCGANAQIVWHDTAQQGFGERTEFCVGGPVSNRRMAAHLHSMLPGVKVNTDPEPGPDQGAFQIGSERYRMEPGAAEYVLLARLTAGEDARPVFLFCGQRAITNQAATRYLARHHEKLARKHGNGSFCLLLKVVNSQAYGPDVVELVADVTRAAQSAVPQARSSHRAAG